MCKIKISFLASLLILSLLSCLSNEEEPIGKIPWDWTEKKIVWLGTSIPAGDKNYPAYTARKLGAQVFNESVGSSMVRTGHTTITEEDPYGWNGLSWENCIYSLTQTIAQKNELINNWDYWKTKLAYNPPDVLTDEIKAKILDSSYENKLQRHLGNNRADLYVFDHGHNDWLWYLPEMANDLTTMPENGRNKNYFLGGMNFLIDKILSDNPHARIVFIGHYENDRKEIVSEAQLESAGYWDVPLCKLWEKLGWTQQIDPETGKTITQLNMSDDLHPYSDTRIDEETGYKVAVKTIGEACYEFLKDLYQ